MIKCYTNGKRKKQETNSSLKVIVGNDLKNSLIRFNSKFIECILPKKRLLILFIRLFFFEPISLNQKMVSAKLA